MIIILLIIQGVFAQTDLDTILAGIYRQQDKMDAEIQDVIFDGSFFYMETNKNGDVIKTINTKRRIYSKGHDKQKSEYLEVIENGKILSEAEKKKVIKQSRGDMKTKLPFISLYRNNYHFQYLGEEYYNDLAVWKIGFKPNQKGKDFVQGFALVEKSDTNVVRYQFTPVGLPFVLKDFNITLDYAKVQSYYVPIQFYFQMEVDVKVIFSLTHKFITMQEIYSNYQFNNGLDDSFFK